MIGKLQSSITSNTIPKAGISTLIVGGALVAIGILGCVLDLIAGHWNDHTWYSLILLVWGVDTLWNYAEWNTMARIQKELIDGKEVYIMILEKALSNKSKPHAPN